MSHKIFLHLAFGILFSATSWAQIKSESFFLYGQKFTVLKPARIQNPEQKLPLVVLFHGCKINADEMIQLGEIEEQMRTRDFLVLAPDQSRFLNLDSCWNWFLPANQQNTYWSELTVQKEALQWALSHYPVAADQVYATGFSSGASIAVNMFYCFPESFAGIATHSGVAFKSATDLYEANTVLVEGSPKSEAQLATAAHGCRKPEGRALKHKHMIVVHGTDDRRVIAKNSAQIARQFLGFWDLADDRQFNRSSAVQKKIFKRGPADFPTEITRHRIGNQATLDSVLVSNLAHRWSGGSAHSPYGEPKSFDATAYIIKTFLTPSSPKGK